MTGVQFRAAVLVPDRSVTLEEFLGTSDNRVGFSMHRYQNVIMDYCKEFYNYSLALQGTNSWGYAQDDGHFDGMVGYLERKEVDFGNSPLICKLDRIPVIDYSYGTWILKSSFIYKRPKGTTGASYKLFLGPLSSNVWLSIVVMMAVMLVILKIMFSRERRILNLLHDSEQYDNYQVDSSWSFLFLFTLGAFCQQGATCYPQFFSSRTLSVFVFLFCILIYQFYSASIVSFLLMDPPRVINNLKDLLDSSLEAGNDDILIDHNYYAMTTDPVAIELYRRKLKGKGGINNTGFYESLEGIDLVRRGGFALHIETSIAYPVIEKTFSTQDICELEEVQMYRTQEMHSGLQKHSPFREMIMHLMVRLAERGNQYRLRKVWDTQAPTCIQKKIEVQVDLKEFSCGPIVLAYGVMLSLMFLVYEMVVCDTRLRNYLLLRLQVLKPFVE